MFRGRKRVTAEEGDNEKIYESGYLARGQKRFHKADTAIKT